MDICVVEQVRLHSAESPVPSLGSYRLVGVSSCGKFHMGEALNGDHVAIKQVSLLGIDRHGDSAQHLRMLNRDADILKRVSWASPVVIRLIDCWLQADFAKACLITEWLPHSMEGVLKQFRQEGLIAVTKTDACRWFAHMVAGIAAIHAAGLVHRDLQPSNIWLTADQQHCKIAGLGTSYPLCRRGAYRICTRSAVDSAASRSRVMGSTHLCEDSKSAIGSTVSELRSDVNIFNNFLMMPTHGAYCSPEFISGNFYSEQTDIFSLGLILLEMLTLGPLAELWIGEMRGNMSPEETAWGLVADARVRCFEDPFAASANIDLSVNCTELTGISVSMLDLDPTKRPSARNIHLYSEKLGVHLRELIDGSQKLRAVFLRRERHVNFQG